MDKQHTAISQLDEKDIKEQPITTENETEIQKHYSAKSFGSLPVDSSSEDNDEEQKEFHDEHASNKILIGGIPLQHIYENSEWIKPFQCFICNNAAVAPIRCSACSTLYCYACLELWGGESKNSKQTCLKCQQGQTLDMNKDKPTPTTTTENQLKPDINTEMFLQEIRVDCAFKTNGCTEIVTYAEYENHLKTCPKRSKICLFCGDNFICDEVNKHRAVCSGKNHSELLALPDNIKNFGMDQSKLLESSLNNSRKPSGLQLGESKSTSNISSLEKPVQFFKATRSKHKNKHSKNNTQIAQKFMNESSLLSASMNNSNLSQLSASAQVPLESSSIFNSMPQQQQQQQQQNQNQQFQEINSNQGFQDFQSFSQQSQKPQQLFMQSDHLNDQPQPFQNIQFQQQSEVKQPKEEQQHAQVQQLSNMNQVNVFPKNNVVVQSNSFPLIVLATTVVVLAVSIVVMLLMQAPVGLNIQQSQNSMNDNLQQTLLRENQELKGLFQQFLEKDRNMSFAFENAYKIYEASLQKAQEVADKYTESLSQNQESQTLLKQKYEDTLKHWFEQQIQGIDKTLQGKIEANQSSHQLDSLVDNLEILSKHVKHVQEQNDKLGQQQTVFEQRLIEIISAIRAVEKQVVSGNSINKSATDVDRNADNKGSMMNTEGIEKIFNEKLNMIKTEILTQLQQQHQAKEKPSNGDDIQSNYENLKVIVEKQGEKVELLIEKLNSNYQDRVGKHENQQGFDNNAQIDLLEIVQAIKNQMQNLTDIVIQLKSSDTSMTTADRNISKTKFIMNSNGISFQKLSAGENTSHSANNGISPQKLGCIYNQFNILDMSTSVNLLQEKARMINQPTQAQIYLKFFELSEWEYITQLQTQTENGSLVAIKISTSEGQNLFCGTYSKVKYNSSERLPVGLRIDYIEKQHTNFVIQFV